MSPEYLAGFFDGEGTFYLGKQIKNGKEYPKAQVLLAQSGDEGKALLHRIIAIYGGNLYQHLSVGEHGATKEAYKVYWNKDEAIKLIEQLVPHLILKQKVALEVYHYLKRNE